MKLLFTAVLCLFLASSASAQNAFKWVMPATDESFTSGNDAPFSGTIQNMTDSTLVLTFERSQTIPDDWQTSVCFGSLCYASFMDKASEAFKPKELREFILHVYAGDNSSGFISSYIKISAATGNPSDTMAINFTAQASPAAGVGASSSHSTKFSIASLAPNPVSGQSKVTVAYRNPASACVSFKAVDLLGRSIALGQASRGSESIQLTMPNLTAGFYMLVAESENGEVSSYPMQVLAR